MKNKYLVGKKNKKLINFLVKENFINPKEYLPFVKLVEDIEGLDFLNH